MPYERGPQPGSPGATAPDRAPDRKESKARRRVVTISPSPSPKTRYRGSGLCVQRRWCNIEYKQVIVYMYVIGCTRQGVS